MLVISCLTLVVLVVGKKWPSVEFLVWTAFLCFMAAALYFDLREPVNYKSLDFDSQGFRFEGVGGTFNVAWSEITDVFYVRYFEHFANQIETEWEFQLRSGSTVRVLVEWPHRNPFAHAVVKNLDFVSAEVVSKVQRLREEGRWRCVDA